MMRIPTTVPDVEALLLSALDEGTAYEWFAVKPERSGVYKLGMLRADLQQHVTPISRYCRVGLQGWSVDSSGRMDAGDAFDIAAAGANALTKQAGVGFILDAEVQSGPLRVTDPITKLEYPYVTLLLEVTV